MVNDRIYLNTPFADKDTVKKLGARWDGDNRGWWITKNGDLNAFKKWLPRMYRPNSPPPHVTSEMIPASTWYVNLRSLLLEEDWDTLRKKCYADAGHRCQVCGQKGEQWPVECNEQWEYIHDENTPKKGIQKLRRLAALCPTCHSIKHLGKASIDGKMEETLKQLAFVNSWTEEQCEEHADKAFQIWEERSEMTWTIDLSFLQEHEIKFVEPKKEICKIIGINISYLSIFNNLSFRN